METVPKSAADWALKPVVPLIWIPVSHPLPILMAVSAVLAPLVICEILIPLRVPALIPAATIFKPFWVIVEAAQVVLVFGAGLLSIPNQPVQLQLSPKMA